MPRTTTASVLALLCAGAICATASAASSKDGGVGYGTAGPTPSVGDGGTLIVRETVLAGHRLHVRGTLKGGDAGRPVTVQRQVKDGGWRQAATTTTTAGGAFDAVWKTRRAGRFTLRAIATPAATPAARAASSASVPATGVTAVSVFRQGVATYFGPGFYGQRTACGQVLRHVTLGVAHRTLPCGTLVDLYYKGATITVPVIDRGPFRAGTTWDLTEATAHAIGTEQTATIGALRAVSPKR